MAEPIKSVPVEWIGLEETPVVFCNSFFCQHQQGEFVLTLGFANAPVFMKPPTPEEIEAIKSVKAKPMLRIALTPERLVELMGVLELNFRQYQNKNLES